MLDVMKRTLNRLRASLTGRADQAYMDRDREGATMREQDYAAGEAHAYGIASDEVRDAEEEHK